jgi:hypothetical protein
VLQSFTRSVASLVAIAVSGCFAPAPQAIREPITVRVTTTDPARTVQFALDVRGGEAELRAREMHGWATDARLNASTPAEVILRPGTTAVSFRALGGGRLNVTATAPHARLWAQGARVRIASTRAGLSIRDY